MSKRKPRHVRRDPEGPIGLPRFGGDGFLSGHPRLRKWIFWVSLLSGWLASIFLGLLDLPVKIVSFAENAPEASEISGNFLWSYRKFEGRFSSDPDAWTGRNVLSDGEPRVDKGDVQLAIEYVGGGRYRGEIHSAEMAKNFAPWSRVMIDGQMNAIGNLRGRVWDIVGNQRTTYSRFTLTVDDDKAGTLRLTPWRNDGVFPGEIILWPTSYEMTDGVSGEAYEKELREMTTNHCLKGKQISEADKKKRYPISCFGPSESGK